ncbi:MAG: hypothetical protein ACRDQD_00530 [Nocardioidaceae bacterium]
MSKPSKFVTKEAWGSTLGRQATPRTHPIGATKGVTIHWEGPRMGTFPHSQCAGKVRGIERYHEENRGWADLAYSGIFCPHGYVFEGRGVNTQTAANGSTDDNDDWYALCYLGGVGDPFTDEAKVALVEGVQWLRTDGNAGRDVNGHRDHKSTECPGDTIYRWIQTANFSAPTQATWTWNPDVVSDLPIIQKQFQIAAGVAKGELKRYHGVAAIQNALNVKNGEELAVDGLCDAKTVAAWKRWETKHPGTGRATTPDMDSLRALQIAYRFKEPAPPKPPAKVTARIGIHNVYVKRKVAEVNQTYAALLAKHRLHAVLLQETAQMYGKWNIPGYKVIQFAPKRLHEGHVIETSSNTVLVRNDVAVEFRDLLDLTETWKGPKVGAMHDPRAPLAVTISVEGKDLDLLDVHGPFGRDAVAEFNAEVAAWLKASRNPAVAGGDYNQEFAAIVAKIGTPSGALVDGQAPDMVATKGAKKLGSANLDRQGSDTHDFKIFDYEI